MGIFSMMKKNNKIKDDNNEIKDKKLCTKLDKNISMLRELFTYPLNVDIVFREIFIPSLKRDGIIVFFSGITDKDSIQEGIIGPLFKNSIYSQENDIDFIAKNVITIKGFIKIKSFREAVDEIISGGTILIIDGFNEGLSFETGKYESRGVEKPFAEAVIKGPKEAFTEAGETNRGLVRKQLKNENLITEVMRVGSRDLGNIYIMYIKNIASPELVDNVKKRIREIDVDSVQHLSILEQHLEERPYSLVPTILETERPDRAAASLLEGHVVLLMDSSPACLVAPVTFWTFFQTSEDMYQRWAYGNWIRLIRVFSILIALLTPAVYISATTYHHEMLPVDLLLSIAANRERMPFPVIVEILLMELSFELLREAGIRIPTAIGPTIGIVGALILGQAAVQANIVSPILVIIVSITGLASFAIPEVGFGFMIRITRFIFLFAAALMGFYAVAVLLIMMIVYLSSIKSFGVPFLAPIAPHYPSSKDTLLRPPVWKQWLRPQHVIPQDRARKKKP